MAYLIGSPQFQNLRNAIWWSRRIVLTFPDVETHVRNFWNWLDISNILIFSENMPKN